MKKSEKITQEDVKHVALLARLSLKNGETRKFVKQLSDIFGYINLLSELKTEGVAETSQVSGLVNRLREDKLEEKRQLTLSQALSGCKKKHNGYFVVKSIFKGENDDA